MTTNSVAIVTGGAGFIGSHLCDSLMRDQMTVICVDSLFTGRMENIAHLLDSPRFSFIKADIADPLPSSLSPDRVKNGFIYNLACPASPPHYQADPEHTLLTCIMGTCHLLRLAEASGARFLQASTSEVYGDPEIHPQHEDYWGHVNPTGPRACYDEGKRGAETLAFDYGRANRAAVRVARIFNTYGPRMRADDGRVVSNVITQALADENLTIYGSGEQTRSFCFVSDLVDGLRRLMALEETPPGAVNLGNPAEITVSDLAETILAMTGSASRVSFRPLPVDDPRRRRPDITRAKSLLGWSPHVGLEKGLADTIAWFEGAGRQAVSPSARRHQVEKSTQPPT